MSEIFIPITALSIPIVALFLRALRRWQELEVERHARLAEQRRRFDCFDDLERRVGRMEQYVTSPEFDLNHQFGKLAEPN